MPFTSKLSVFRSQVSCQQLPKGQGPADSDTTSAMLCAVVYGHLPGVASFTSPPNFIVGLVPEMLR